MKFIGTRTLTYPQMWKLQHWHYRLRAWDSTWICSGVHWSRLTDLTRDMCTPRFRWIPAHLMQINTPRFQEAHRGPAWRKEKHLLDCRSLPNPLCTVFPPFRVCTWNVMRTYSQYITSSVCRKAAAAERDRLAHNHCIHRRPTLKYTFLKLQVITV